MSPSLRRPTWGARGRQFKSARPDHSTNSIHTSNLRAHPFLRLELVPEITSGLPVIRSERVGRPDVRHADFSLMWFLWTAYLGSDRRNSHTSHNKTPGPEELPVSPGL